jgi:hypothetical protein
LRGIYIYTERRNKRRIFVALECIVYTHFWF